MKKSRILAVLAAMAMGLAVFGCSNGGSDSSESGSSGGSSSESAVFQSSKFSKGILQIEYKTDGTFLMTLSEGDYYSAASARDFGKGTYTLDGTFENGTIHLHQTHTPDSSGWVEHVEDMTLAVKDGKFTVDDMGLTFTKVGSSSSSGSGTGSESGSTGGSSSESAVFQSSRFSKGILKIEYKADGTFLMTLSSSSSGSGTGSEGGSTGGTTSGGGSESGSAGGTTSGGGSESGSTGGSSSESAVFQSSKFSKGILQIEYKADHTFSMTLSEGDYYSAESVRDFGKGTYTLDGTFENGTIHLHQTHTSGTSGWVEHVEDMTLAVKDGKFTVDDMGLTFTKVGSSSSSGSIEPNPEGFVKIPAASIKGTESWTPESEVFVSGRKLEIASFYMSDHPVTRGEYKAVMGNDPSIANAYDKDGNKLTGDDNVKNNPVNGGVSWYDVLVYCNTLSIKEKLTPCYAIDGKTAPKDWGSVPTSRNDTWAAATCDFTADGYRLPTEAEWEWAARGGENYTYAGSDDIDDVAWYIGNTKHTGTRDVKTKKANGYGLYDMSGNVFEWCWDWYGSISSGTPDTGPASDSSRCLRGGSWFGLARIARVAYRISYSPSGSADIYGFRVVRSAN